MSSAVDVAGNLARVRENIARAARRSGRGPDEVRLVAVTKGVPAHVLREALEAGVTDLGENRVQEAEAKQAELGPLDPGVRWHLIGHLQTNKAKRAAQSFQLIHSVDSFRVARALSRAVAGGSAGTLDVLVQTNVSGEESKYGVDPGGAADLCRTVGSLEGLRVKGLMTMAPFTDDPEETRPVFRRLRELAREIKRLGLEGVSMELLSMGMTQDYEVAVEEGSNLVRVGTAIFGPRQG